MTPTVSPALKSYFSFSLEYLQWGIMMKRWLAQPLGNWQVGEEDLLELGNLLEELQHPWNTNLWTVSKEILVERGLRDVQPAFFGLSRVNSWSIGKRVTHSNVQSKEERRSSTQQMHNWLVNVRMNCWITAVELLNGVPGERDGGLKGERLRLMGSIVWWIMEGNGEWGWD